MSELLLINPRRRKRRAKRKTVSGRRNPRRMTALQAKYFGGGRKRRASSRRRRSVTVSGRRNPVAVSRRRRSGSRRSLKGFKLIPTNFIKGTVLPAAIGGAGALAVDIVWGILPIPAGIKTGPLGPLAKVAGALGVGAVASMVGGRAMGEKVVGGYLTVMAYNFARDLVSKAAPQLTLGDYSPMGYYQGGQFLPDNSMGVYVGDTTTMANPNAAGMGAYISGYAEGDNADPWN